MARKPRVHLPGAFYHVMLRGNRGDTIFFDNKDREVFILLLSECIKRFNFRVHAFCLKTNHVHLAIQVGEIPLAKIIQNISFRYTRIMNKKLNRIGHLFQGRYKAIMLDADSYLLQLIRYIHYNPVRANMVSRIDEYVWSSHFAYLGLAQVHWLTTQHVLSYFSSDYVNAVSNYKEFCLPDDENDAEINFDKGNQESFPIICDDSFMKKLAHLLSKQSRQYNITLEKIVDFSCKFYSIDEKELHSTSRQRLNAKIRAVIAWLAIEFKICSITQVACYFKRDHSTVTRILNRIISSSENQELERMKKLFENALTQA